MVLTEKDASIAYAKAWNRLDCSDFLTLLDENAHYASQWVFEELESKEAISEYLLEKMKTVESSGSKVYAELGNTGKSSAFPGRDCVLLAQGEEIDINATIVFDVRNGKITRFDLCMPSLLNVMRTGIYPI
jgi:hypothetical protein